MARRRKRILLVEDNADVRQLLALFIESLGYEVYTAATGLEAVDQTATARPDLIIMDFCLPGVSGVEATRRLKTKAATKDIPVLIVTGYPIEQKRALAAGAADILPKPVDMTTFRALLRRHLSARTKLRGSRSKQ